MENLNKLRELQTKRYAESSSYEENKSFEMAYIAMWSVLEKGLHIYANDAVKHRLHTNVQKWDKYLSGTTKSKPEPIGNFSLEHSNRTIPPVPLIESILGKMSQVSKVLDSKGKYRIKRNKIAHEASRFINEDKYKEYKHELMKAIDQLSRKAAIYAQRD